MKQEPKNESGGRLFYLRHFRAVFDYRSSFFAPKLHENACYAGYICSVLLLIINLWFI